MQWPQWSPGASVNFSIARNVLITSRVVLSVGQTSNCMLITVKKKEDHTLKIARSHSKDTWDWGGAGRWHLTTSSIATVGFSLRASLPLAYYPHSRQSVRSLAVALIWLLRVRRNTGERVPIELTSALSAGSFVRASKHSSTTSQPQTFMPSCLQNFLITTWRVPLTRKILPLKHRWKSSRKASTLKR